MSNRLERCRTDAKPRQEFTNKTAWQDSQPHEMQNSANYVGHEGYESSRNHDAGTIQDISPIKQTVISLKNKSLAFKSL